MGIFVRCSLSEVALSPRHVGILTGAGDENRSESPILSSTDTQYTSLAVTQLPMENRYYRCCNDDQ